MGMERRLLKSVLQTDDSVGWLWRVDCKGRSGVCVCESVFVVVIDAWEGVGRGESRGIRIKCLVLHERMCVICVVVGG